MSWGRAERLEFGVDSLAASALALAGGFAATAFGPAVIAATFGSAAGLAAYLGLRAIAPEPVIFALADFAPSSFEAPSCDELILTNEDRLRAPIVEADTTELLLDDILAKLGPESRVVRLFDPATMPTPRELQDRIDRHLDRSRPLAPPDASQALYDALAELRRSLN